ncbi:Ig domain-containing protein [Myxococcus xanthus]|uniref:Ig domain-containing protein n=1 Tax=Myxococcus xanthus TaxID=34 RepID=UPI003456F836
MRGPPHARDSGVIVDAGNNPDAGTDSDAGADAGQDGPPGLTTEALPEGTVSRAYTTTLAAAGGIAPLTWSITEGTAPAGLTLSATGTLSDTPAQVAASTFTVSWTLWDATNGPRAACLRAGDATGAGKAVVVFGGAAAVPAGQVNALAASSGLLGLGQLSRAARGRRGVLTSHA